MKTISVIIITGNCITWANQPYLYRTMEIRHVGVFTQNIRELTLQSQASERALLSLFPQGLQEIVQVR